MAPLDVAFAIICSFNLRSSKSRINPVDHVRMVSGLERMCFMGDWAGKHTFVCMGYTVAYR